MYVQKLPQKISFDKVGIRGKIYPKVSDSQKSHFLVIETEKGHETKILEKECDFYYFILEGKGQFEIDGVKEKCEKGDLVVIPKGKAFQYFGKLKMLLVTTPVWWPEQEETLI